VTDQASAVRGEIAGARHLFPVRVYYEDTDFSGVVYHASYLRFLERGRTELLRAIGLHQFDLVAQPHELIFVVRRMTIDFRRPARMDDELVIETRLGALKAASLDLLQRVLRNGDVVAEAQVNIAALTNGRPARMPPQVRSAFAGLHSG
jgi:acyl-CoA thioester hydrolase